MEETPSWKGHSFTLTVFGGIVVLCSIFFVLGMLVGRSQGQRIAEIAAADEAGRTTAAQPLPDARPLEYHEETTGANPDLSLVPSAAAATEAPPAVEPSPVETPVAEKHYLQILAAGDKKGAESAREKVISQGFQALTLAPAAGSKDAFYRVLVGPYETVAAANIAKRDLESHGYKDPILK